MKEVKRYALSDIISERRRIKHIGSMFGWQVAGMYSKISAESLDDFRYMLVFNDHASFEDGKARLKELDIIHGKQYRFSRCVMVFRDINVAILCRLSFADNTSDIYDLETLKKIDIKEDDTNSG